MFHLYRFLFLNRWIKIEKSYTQILLKDTYQENKKIFFYNCKDKSQSTKDGCLEAAIKESTIGLTILSIIASTSPFLGLFGTVVGILESFATFKEGVTLSAIAPAISEALIATAGGILVAIPAYTFNLLLKRKAYEIISYFKIQLKLMDNE